ncbi:molybdopterin-guanine dinucleotide biosynthesis protein A [Pseudobutyrivibrio sp. ACV-2]|uniref:molybdenum cofactor guanylyltransferase n=1 Tax=Pseudobutyrivibrio sp. ACV-2 TaxID=1520801 RepID=UPI00089BF06B|nr:molybdenum cofactor guanylyltransferase [Pseudobutyrivibrio sp. ACV-2]SEA84983.1 molybdopterin-guanine dinucleotide biosynthesis protein A [Pseudobutyrivibrio sp. ACV-2]
MNRTLVILCGGDSSRMGTKKALLPFEDKTMVEYIYDKFSPFFDKVYLSVNERGDLAHLGLDAQEIPDISRNAGPYGAILSCLTMITGDRAFFMSVDTPFLDPRTAVYLYDQSYNYDITTFRFPDNLLDTICGVYNKRCIGAFFKSLFFKKTTRNYVEDRCYTNIIDTKLIEDISTVSMEQQFYKVNDRQSYYYAVFSILKRNFTC